MMVTAAPTPAASLVVPACAAIGASYPALMDPNSTASFFPSIPPIANTSGAPPGAGSTAGGGNGTGQPPPPPPFFPSINVTDGEVAQLFAQVCETAAFQSAFNSTGVQNFSLGGSFNARNGTAFIGYSFVWVAGCPPGAWVAYGLCSFEESWLANVTSKVITGPTVTVMPAVSSYGPGGSTAPPRVPSASFGAGPANVPVALLL
ncbi:MAG TPA: hypothetical protein VEY07_08110, partial [Thermoplasmata archaeon]|nr:hypothetical protein [Thermoplasmata archaeon]